MEDELVEGVAIGDQKLVLLEDVGGALGLQDDRDLAGVRFPDPSGLAPSLGETWDFFLELHIISE